VAFLSLENVGQNSHFPIQGLEGNGVVMALKLSRETVSTFVSAESGALECFDKSFVVNVILNERLSFTSKR